MSTAKKGFLIVFVSAFCFALLPILGKVAYGFGAKPLSLLAWRFITAALVLWLTVPFVLAKELRVGRKNLVHFLIQGVLGYGLASIGFFNALTYLDASLVSILFYTYPAWVAILSRFFFKEKLSPLRVLTILITFLGCLLVTNLLSSSKAQVAWQGVMYGLQAALAYAIFNVYSQKTTANTNPLIVSTYSVTAMAVFFVAIAPKQEVINLSLPILGVAAVIGVAATVIPIATYLTGIKYVGASKASIISTFEPVFTILMAYMFLSETLNLFQALGACLVFAGIMLLQFEKQVRADSGSEKETIQEISANL